MYKQWNPSKQPFTNRQIAYQVNHIMESAAESCCGGCVLSQENVLAEELQLQIGLIWTQTGFFLPLHDMQTLR